MESYFEYLHASHPIVETNSKIRKQFLFYLILKIFFKNKFLNEDGLNLCKLLIQYHTDKTLFTPAVINKIKNLAERKKWDNNTLSSLCELYF
jgi:hypothetical protein